MPRDHDHDDVGVHLEGPGQDLHPRDPGHLEVGEDDVGPLARQKRQRLGALGGGDASVVFATEESRPVGDHIGLVVDDQDPRLSAHSGTYGQKE